jgi:MATE family multidrug resistance protein
MTRDTTAILAGGAASRWTIPLQLLQLSAPVIASMISRVAMGFVDFAMVSTLGTQAQAAMPAANMVLFSVIGFGMGALSMVNTFVSQALGRSEPRECSAFAWQGAYLGLLLWCVALPGWWAIPSLFAWIGHEPGVQALEVEYAKIGLLSMGPALASMALAGFFTGLHRPRVPLIAAVVSNLFNVAGNYALIFGHWGFPAMGVAGAAWATTLASVLNAAILLAWLLTPTYQREFFTRDMWRPSLERMKRLSWFGLPAGAHFAFDIATWTVFTNVFVGRFGQEQLAAHNICMQFLHLSFMPAVGIGVALGVMVGKFIGERQLAMAHAAVRWGMTVGLAYMGLLGVAMFVWRFDLVLLFNDDPEVVKWGGRIFIFCAMFQVFDAMNIVYSHALRGAGDTHWPAYAIFILASTLLVGGCLLAVKLFPQWGSAGPWTAATVYIVVLGSVFALRYRWGPWAKIELFKPQAA